MNWQNPWAFIGMACIAVPVLIHLLSRHEAARMPFPSLRFLVAAKSAPVRRTRITDWPMMVLRLLIVATAVLALAAPLLETDARRAAAARALARAVIVDTSFSMRRVVDEARALSLLDSARTHASTLIADATVGVIIETAAPASMTPAASTWLAAQQGRRELVVVSDFQPSAIDSATLSDISADVGVNLVRIPAAAGSRTELRSRGIARTVVTTRSADSGFLWTTLPDTAPSAIVALVVDESRPAALAVQRAVNAGPAPDSGVRVAIVYPGFPQREDLRARARPISGAKMANVLAGIRRDDLLPTLTPDAVVDSAFGDDTSPFVVAARTAGGAIGHAAAVDIDGAATLAIFTTAEPGSIVDAALVRAIDRALRVELEGEELDERSLDEAILHSWQRDASSGAETTLPAESDGRWFWLAVLALIAIETLTRRGRAESVNAAV